jgi:anti-sigma factor RsiW
MTNDPLYHPLRELSWRRKLTAAEAAELRAWLAAHPEARADWETEAGLNDALGRLPNAPVGSNFTACVLQAVERDAAVELRRRERRWRFSWRLRWLPQAAAAAVVLGVVLVSYREFITIKLARYGQSVAVVSKVSALPSAEALKDFDAIRALNPTPAADEELLAALK